MSTRFPSLDSEKYFQTSRVIGKDGFHYGKRERVKGELGLAGVMLGAFFVISIFQLICFFGLTISDNWTHCRLEKGRHASRQTLQRHELAAHIRHTIHAIIYRVLCEFSLSLSSGIPFYEAEWWMLQCVTCSVR